MQFQMFIQIILKTVASCPLLHPTRRRITIFVDGAPTGAAQAVKAEVGKMEICGAAEQISKNVLHAVNLLHRGVRFAVGAVLNFLLTQTFP